MKIGITEYGDAGIDLRWIDKVPKMDGAVIITKNLTDKCKEGLLLYKDKVVLHCTCTGYGSTVIEPNVPNFQAQLNSLKDLIEKGFPASHVVLRIDPIFPTEKGLSRVKMVLDYFNSLGIPNKEQIRFRMSIVDEYPHVRERYRICGLRPIYNGYFQAPAEMIQFVGEELSKTGLVFNTCAEDKLAALYPNTFEIKGCISKDDLDILGLMYDQNLFENPQKRTGCHCLSCKRELLTPRKKCPHGCLYCFWKD